MIVIIQIFFADQQSSKALNKVAKLDAPATTFTKRERRRDVVHKRMSTPRIYLPHCCPRTAKIEK